MAIFKNAEVKFSIPPAHVGMLVVAVGKRERGAAYKAAGKR